MNDGKTMDDRLHNAAGRGDLALVKQMVKQGCDVNAFDDIGNTPLHRAVAGEKFETAAFLLAAGADVNARDESRIGDTPLADNAQHCSLKMARLLVDAGADPTIRGWMQLNALDRARERKREEGIAVCKLLDTIATTKSRIHHSAVQRRRCGGEGEHLP